MTNDKRIAIDEDGDVTLPVVEVLTGRAFLTGKSGAGKSNSASVVAEELEDRVDDAIMDIEEAEA